MIFIQIKKREPLLNHEWRHSKTNYYYALSYVAEWSVDTLDGASCTVGVTGHYQVQAGKRLGRTHARETDVGYIEHIGCGTHGGYCRHHLFAALQRIDRVVALGDRCRLSMECPRGGAAVAHNGVEIVAIALDEVLLVVARIETPVDRRATYELYDAMTDHNRTFTCAVVDCTQLDALADVCRRIQAAALPLATTSGLQCYNINGSRFFFDLMQYYRAICPDELRGELEDIYNKVVLYKAATPTIFGRVLIDPAHFSGLSTYIPGTSPGVNETYYHELAWYRSVF